MTALSFPEKSTSVTKEPQFNGDKKRPLDPQDGPGTRHDQPLQRPPGPRWSDLLWRFFVRIRSARGRRIQDFYQRDRKSTRLNSSHLGISYAVFCLKKK